MSTGSLPDAAGTRGWSTSVGVSGLGWYVPRFRLASSEWQRAWPGASADGAGTVAVPDSDEDVVTMGVEAADRALSDAGIGIEEVEEIYFATVSSPYTTKSSAAVLAVGLGAGPVRTVDFGGSTRAVADALLAAFDAVASGRAKSILVIGSDLLAATPGDTLETRFGAAAGAVVVDAHARLLKAEAAAAHSSTTTPHWRCSDSAFVQRYDDPRLEREGSIVPNIVLAAAQIVAADDLVVVPGIAAKLEKVMAKMLPAARFAPQAKRIAELVGDTGNAHALIGVAEALAAGPTNILVAFEGSGAGGEAIRFSVGGPVRPSLVPAISGGVQIDYVSYLKATGRLNAPGSAGPASPYAASPGWIRDERHLLAPLAALCESCGSLNYPPREICIDCRSFEMAEVPLPRHGTVLTYNVQHIVPVLPEEAPVAVCVAQMDGAPADGYGGKVTALMVREAATEVRIGSSVELIFRRAGVEHGLVRYGYKFALKEAQS